MEENILRFIEEYEYFALFILMFLENLFPPIPSELILPLTGFAVSNGKLAALPALLAASLGSLAGALFWYVVGRKLGDERTSHFINRHGKWLTLTDKDYRKSRDFFEKHGTLAVFVGRMLPVIRTVISIPAGIFKMGIRKFLIYTSLGTLLWSGLLILIGYALGNSFDIASRYVGYASNLIILIIIVTYFYRLWTYSRSG
jgi:membrane protein DedA with SNARE-associated domain